MLNARKSLAAISIIFFSASCTYAARYQILTTIEQKNELGVVASYNFELAIFRQYSSSDVGEDKYIELVSPQGVRYPDNGSMFDFITVEREGISLNELTTNVLGSWTFEESLAGLTKRYQIAVPQLPSNFFNITAPEILSPGNGDVVGKVFNLLYTNPDPNGIGISYGAIPSPGFILGDNFERNAPGDYTVSFIGEEYPRIEFRRFNIVKKLTSPNVQVTPLTSNADATFSRFTSFEVHSNTIAFTVVPEPAPLMLLGVAMICATSGRGFVRK